MGSIRNLFVETSLVAKRVLALLFAFAGTAFMLHAQAVPTAKRALDLQVGGGLSLGKPDYTNNTWLGYNVYVDLDFTKHWGVEANLHQIAETSDNYFLDDAYEKTYEIGARYHRNYGRFHPYAKGLYGRGVFNFPNDKANLAYNIFSLGGGVDMRITKHINARIFDYEYQHWMGFLNDSLTPSVASFGVAYHFGSDRTPR